MTRDPRPFRWLAPVLAGGLGLFGGPVSAQSAADLPAASTDAFLHVVAHEMGHAFLREFDIPILGPEEDIADDFATIYVYLTLPDRAEAIISARARQHMADGDRPGMFSEYRSDDQRAGRSICLLYGQDPERFDAMARRFGLDGDAAGNCRDFATEAGRSWRRIIDDYRMPAGARVTEAGVDLEETPIARALTESGALDEAYALLSGIDWHSRVTLTVKPCSGSSFWSRNGRRITICDTYLLRFADQLAD
ncbi:MAG: hypothetical protein EP318_02315 [Rhodobacteraceae bacterium]|nr:MAG: hypothetical protein EP318_02315 [Paracoccaceae bacterium]